uniref:Uncharacterized protein n=1 Tax=Branchiostoma floridae TaxID=7739 RepID=C3ZYJ7_BRAFL|eukprot:XP_002586370.1 hypothetical protein BRAFLDRAFT_108655 [Branchiostoma floridae]
MLLILRGVNNDLIAAEAKYHKACQSSYTSKSNLKSAVSSSKSSNGFQTAFQDLVDEIKPDLNSGRAYTMSVLLGKYKTYLRKRDVDDSSYTSQHLKTKLQAHPIGKGIVFHVPYDRSTSESVYSNSISLQDVINTAFHNASTTTQPTRTAPPVQQMDKYTLIYHAAKAINADIGDITGIPTQPINISDMTLTQCKSMVPDSLYKLFQYMLTGGDAEPSDDLERKIVMMTQDAIHVASHDGVKTPKHTCLGLTVRHLIGSKQLLTILNRMGHCSSYDEVEIVDTSLAMETIAKADLYGLVLPSNISPGVFVQAVADNNDLNGETLDGKNTTHANTLVLFQKGTFGPTQRRQTLADHSVKRKSLISFSAIDILSFGAVMPEDDAVRLSAYKKGLEQCTEFVQQRLNSEEVGFWEALPHLKIKTFYSLSRKKQMKTNDKVLTRLQLLLGVSEGLRQAALERDEVTLDSAVGTSRIGKGAGRTEEGRKKKKVPKNQFDSEDDIPRCENAPKLRLRPYHRPGAPTLYKAGIMTYTKISTDEWIQVGRVRVGDRLAVDPLARIAKEDLVIHGQTPLAKLPQVVSGELKEPSTKTTAPSTNTTAPSTNTTAPSTNTTAPSTKDGDQSPAELPAETVRDIVMGCLVLVMDALKSQDEKVERLGKNVDYMMTILKRGKPWCGFSRGFWSCFFARQGRGRSASPRRRTGATSPRRRMDATSPGRRTGVTSPRRRTGATPRRRRTGAASPRRRTGAGAASPQKTQEVSVPASTPGGEVVGLQKTQEDELRRYVAPDDNFFLRNLKQKLPRETEILVNYAVKEIVSEPANMAGWSDGISWPLDGTPIAASSTDTTTLLFCYQTGWQGRKSCLKLLNSYFMEGCNNSGLKDVMRKGPPGYPEHHNARVIDQLMQRVNVNRPALTRGERPCLVKALAVLWCYNAYYD